MAVLVPLALRVKLAGGDEESQFVFWGPIIWGTIQLFTCRSHWLCLHCLLRSYVHAWRAHKVRPTGCPLFKAKHDLVLDSSPHPRLFRNCFSSKMVDLNSRWSPSSCVFVGFEERMAEWTDWSPSVEAGYKILRWGTPRIKNIRRFW